MPRAHKLAPAGLAIAVLFAGSLALAQQSPPDMRMLLNLDLFAAHPSDAPSEPGANPSSKDSMLEQIQTLQALGYLRGGQGHGRAAPQPLSSWRQWRDDSNGDEP
jgi:hypothetical protein